MIGVVMITGDNALTGSNIGYKCGISHRNQGMIICDYKDGKFTEERFIYFENEINYENEQKGSSNRIEERTPQEIELQTIQRTNKMN